MGDDLKEVLTLLHEAGAEGVPAHDIAWQPHMMPAINTALNMGYMQYRERQGERYFSLTPFGYQKIGIAPFSVQRYLLAILKRSLGFGRR